MKRFFPTGVALLLVIGSLGHVVAAALCPRSLGLECCWGNTSKHAHDSSSSHQDAAVHRDGMPMDSLAMDETAAVEVSNSSTQSLVDGEVSVSRFDQPVESCAHCLSHSGIPNAPASFVSAPDESRKAVDLDQLDVLSFQAASLTTVTQKGSPREHSPPGKSAPRHILLSVFLI
jgi:hypothetical protein